MERIIQQYEANRKWREKKWRSADKDEERTWLIFGDSVTDATEKTMHRPIDEKPRKLGSIVRNPNFKLESIKRHETSSLYMNCCRIVQAIKISNTTLRRMLDSLTRKQEEMLLFSRSATALAKT